MPVQRPHGTMRPCCNDRVTNNGRWSLRCVGGLIPVSVSRLTKCARHLKLPRPLIRGLQSLTGTRATCCLQKLFTQMGKRRRTGTPYDRPAACRRTPRRSASRRLRPDSSRAPRDGANRPRAKSSTMPCEPRRPRPARSTSLKLGCPRLNTVKSCAHGWRRLTPGGTLSGRCTELDTGATSWAATSTSSQKRRSERRFACLPSKYSASIP